jgi:hypothetical protein
MHHPQGTLFCGVALVATALLAFTTQAPADDPEDVTGPVLAAARDAVAKGHVTQSNQLGFSLGKPSFNDAPDGGGVLIGFDLGVGKFFDIETIYAARAVFMTPGGDEEMPDHGLFRNKVLPKKTLKTQVRRTVHLRAKPGYAVGAMTLRSGLNINGLSLTYMRMRGKALDPNDSYESEWVADRTGGGEASVGGDGAPVVGVFGTQDDEKVSSLGLTFVAAPPPPVPPAPPVRPAPPLVQPAPPIPPLVDQLFPPHDENPPAPPLAAPIADVQPAVPPQAAGPPAPAAPAKVAAPPAAQASIWPLFAYGLPIAAFVAVAGLGLVFALLSVGRRGQPVKPNGRPPQSGARRPSGSPPSPAPTSTALQERPHPVAVAQPRPDDDVLELGPDDFEVIPDALPVQQSDAQKPPTAPADDWPRLEL